mmetsp:Transcript_14461/g.22748  ORF Transcript_14461/g.22748 Transcript_14461/m.22748 type:complete len:176 (-) Transcript_14461:357-884(-)
MRVQVTVGGVEEGRGERACRGGELKHVVGEVSGLGDREVDEVAEQGEVVDGDERNAHEPPRDAKPARAMVEEGDEAGGPDQVRVGCDDHGAEGPAGPREGAGVGEIAHFEVGVGELEERNEREREVDRQNDRGDDDEVVGAGWSEDDGDGQGGDDRYAARKKVAEPHGHGHVDEA